MNKHTIEIKVGYLVTGLVFVGIATVWWLHNQGVVGTDGLTWLLPAILFGAGLAGVIATVLKGVTGRASREPASQTKDPTIEQSTVQSPAQSTAQSTTDPAQSTAQSAIDPAQSTAEHTAERTRVEGDLS